MWKQLLELVQQLFTLAKDLERSREDLKESKAQILKLTLIVQDLTNKMEMIAQQERSARENLTLTLKMEILAQQERHNREKLELQNMQAKKLDYVRQLDGIPALAKVAESAQE